MKASFVLLCVLNGSLYRSLIEDLCGSLHRLTRRRLADFLEGFHYPALRLLQPTTCLEECATLRDAHRGGRAASTFKSSFRLQLTTTLGVSTSSAFGSSHRR